MGREWISRRRRAPPGRASHPGFFVFQKSEGVLLLLAVLLYWFSPNWPAVRFARANLQGVFQNSWDQKFSNISSWRDARRSLGETRRFLDQSQTELEMTRAQLRVLSLQILENDALRSLFLLPERPEYRYIYGEVISRRILPTESRLFIKIPSGSYAADGLGGAPVVASFVPNWVAVGQVMDVRRDVAEVMLLSDPRSRIGVTLADTSAFGSALLVGAGLNGVELDFATHPHFLRDLSAHQQLVTAKESHFPVGLGVAELLPADGRLLPSCLLPFGEIKYVVILARARAMANPQQPSETSALGASAVIKP